MKKVMIIGSGGAGKSTLARQLGEILDLEVIHLDALHWQPGWTVPLKDDWQRLHEALVWRDAWILDGNYGATMDQRLAAADTVIFLDLPPLTCLWRVIRRRFRHAGRSRPVMAPGCPEQLDAQFLWWVWTFRRRRRPVVVARLERHAEGRRIIHLRRAREVRQFLEAVRSERGAGASLARR